MLYILAIIKTYPNYNFKKNPQNVDCELHLSNLSPILECQISTPISLHWLQIKTTPINTDDRPSKLSKYMLRDRSAEE